MLFGGLCPPPQLAPRFGRLFNVGTSIECWPGSKVLILKYRDLMSMSTSNTRGTYYPSDRKIINMRVLITKINQLSTQP